MSVGSSQDEYEFESGDDEEELAYTTPSDHDTGEQGLLVARLFSSRDSKGASSGRSSLLELEPLRHMCGDSYVVVEVVKVEPSMHELITDCASLLNISNDGAIAMLINFQWNKEKLIDIFYADPDKILDEVGLCRVDSNKVDDIFEHFECKICYCQVETQSEQAILTCGHKFCSGCFSHYLRIQVDEGPSSIRATCAQHKCKCSVPYSMFKRYLEPDQFMKYHQYILGNYIETSKTMRYCPAPNCCLVSVAQRGVRSIRCRCAATYCFACGDESHQPASCKQLSDWTEKCANESETANWIIVNTKKCPKCESRIEKNQGCNHMRCKVCTHDFCWVCLGDWKDHGQQTGGYYNCNKFASKVDNKKDAAAKAKAELERYLHYIQRYQNHAQSAKFASKQREHAERRMLELQAAEQSSWMEVQYLSQAVEVVVDCRRTLKYTYIMGFFMSEDSRLRSLFEHNQEMLEKNTERYTVTLR
jgi:ariadne-1